MRGNFALMNRRQAVRLLFAAPLVGGSVLSTVTPALARQTGQKRVALVIGNRTYKNANPLKNPVNDATDVADALKDCDFTVILRTDRTDDEMSADIKAFKAQLTPSTVALFYFSGHGMQIDGKNYLLPVDFQSDDPDEMKKHSVEADAVLEKMTCAFRIMILDACRNVPFTRAKGDTGKGLNFMTIPEDYDTLIAYATAPGSIADDNPKERNGIYTKHLLREVRKPGASLSDLFSNVSRAVKTETGQRQRPRTDYETLPAFCFVPARIEPFTLKGHSDWITSVLFSPDGKQIVTGSFDKTAKVWDAATGRELFTLKGHSGLVRSVSFSPDGKRIGTGSADDTAKVWDAATGKQLVTLQGHSDPANSQGFIKGDNSIVIGWEVMFSPDWKRIVTGSFEKTVKVWDAATGKQLATLKGHSNSVWSLSFSPNGKRIVTGSWDETAKVWDATTGRELFALTGHTYPVTSVSFSPDGKQIVTGSQDNTAKVWDAATGRELFTLTGHSSYVTSVSFSRDGKQIVTGSADRTAKVWDAATGRELFTLTGHSDWVTSASFSPDGKQIVTGSTDKTAKVWELRE